MKEWPSVVPGVAGVPDSQALVLSTQLTAQHGICTRECPNGGVEKERPAGSCRQEDEDAGYCNWYGPKNSVAEIRGRYCIFQDPNSVVDEEGMLCRDVKQEAMSGVNSLVNATNAELEGLRAVIIDPEGALA